MSLFRSKFGLFAALAVALVACSFSDDGSDGDGDGGDGDGDGDTITSPCAAGQTECAAGVCAELLSDPLNCGACGVACETGLVCSAGSCTDGCPADATVCGASCANTTSNPSHCGGCNIACGAGQTCNNGICEGGPTGTGGAGTGGSATGGGTSTGGTAAGGSGTGGTATGGSATGGGDMGTGGGSGGDMGTGGDGTGGSTATVGDRPCDLYEDGGTPCAAAYSTIRRLKSDYTGPLYQIRVGSSEYNIGGQRVTNPDSGPQADQPYQTTPEEGTLVDVPQTADGYADPSIQESSCPLGTTCTVSLLYDQSGNGTHLPVANGGLSNGGTYAEYDNFETVMDSRAQMTVAGHNVYSLYMQARQGYRIEEVGAAMPVDQEPQGIYMLADGTRVGGACCWDFGNVTTNPASYAEMNTLFFGEAYWGDGNGSPPWFGADFEAGVWMGGSQEGDPGWGELNSDSRPPNPNNPSMAGVPFALGFLKTDDDQYNTYALRMANLADSSITEAYRGDYPKWSYANHGTDNRGAVVLGVGGDNSNNSYSTFYEGAIVAGFPDDATEQAVMENIQAAGYGQ